MIAATEYRDRRQPRPPHLRQGEALRAGGPERPEIQFGMQVGSAEAAEAVTGEAPQVLRVAGVLDADDHRVEVPVQRVLKRRS